MTTLTVHLNDAQASILSTMAGRLHETPEETASHVLQFYLENEQQFIEQVLEGLAAAEKGEFVPDDEMSALFDRLTGRAKSE